jgi:hypothetical protein
MNGEKNSFFLRGISSYEGSQTGLGVNKELQKQIDLFVCLMGRNCRPLHNQNQIRVHQEEKVVKIIQVLRAVDFC